MRLASSLAVGDTVGPRDAVVVAIEPLNETNMLRITLFVDGGIEQQDAHQADTFDNAKSPPALLNALHALAGLHAQLTGVRAGPAAEHRAADVLAIARRRGIVSREFGVYTMRK